MKFDSKVKGGLAWAGLFVILAVPSADLLFGPKEAAKANIAVTSDTKPVVKAPAAATDPVKTASIDTPAAKSDDPVDTYLAKGKKLPAYISDADTASAPAVKPPAPVAPAKPVEVATATPVTETPPVPLPRDARPKVKAPVVASVPKAPAAQPLIIDENELAQRQATLKQPKQPVEPFPLSDGGSGDEAVVTGDQLEEWDSGSLADYLERKGLLNQASDERDDNQFVFNEGPSPKRRRPLESFFIF
jgi:hypothetical protein